MSRQIFFFSPPPNVKGGALGPRGEGGFGGLGGRGGMGGAGLLETKTVYQTVYNQVSYVDYSGVTRYRTDIQSVPTTVTIPHRSGYPGRDGPTGPSGRPGNSGRPGREGSIEYQLVLGTSVARYSELFTLSISSFGDFGFQTFYEPGATYAIRSIQIKNTSSMPLPALSIPLKFGLKTDGSFLFDQTAAVPISSEIKGNSRFSLPRDVIFRIRPINFAAIRENTVYSKTAKATYRLIIPRIGLEFTYETPSPITITFPVRLSRLALPDIAIDTHQTPFSIQLSNVFATALGAASPSRRRVLFKLEQNRSHDVSFVRNGTSTSLQRGWYETSIEMLRAKTTQRIAGSLVFSASVPKYTPIGFVAKLKLEDVADPNTLNVIQHIPFSLTISQRFVFNRDSDVILCVNHQTPAKAIQAWKNYCAHFKMDVSLWDVSLYNGFRFSHKVGDASLREEWADKVVVFLNHSYDSRNTGRTILPASLLRTKDVYKALGSVGLYIIGGSGLSIPLFRAETITKRYASPDALLKSTLLDRHSYVVHVQKTLYFASRPGEDMLIASGKALLDELVKKHPEKRYHIQVNYMPRCTRGSLLKKEWALGALIVTQDKPLALIQDMRKNELVCKEERGTFLQAIRLFPFQRKLDLLAQSPRSTSVKKAILADLIGEVVPYFRKDSRRPLSEKAQQNVLKNLACFESSSLEREAAKSIMLTYEAVLLRMKKKSTLFCKRFDAMVDKITWRLQTLRTAKGIREDFYRIARSTIAEECATMKVEELINRYAEPDRNEDTIARQKQGVLVRVDAESLPGFQKGSTIRSLPA